MHNILPFPKESSLKFDCQQYVRELEAEARRRNIQPSQDDWRWFRQHPDREYRVRRTVQHRDCSTADDEYISVVHCETLKETILPADEHRRGSIIDTDAYARMRLAYLAFVQARLAHLEDAPKRLRGAA